jgi:hypothetical protein
LISIAICADSSCPDNGVFSLLETRNRVLLD